MSLRSLLSNLPSSTYSTTLVQSEGGIMDDTDPRPSPTAENLVSERPPSQKRPESAVMAACLQSHTPHTLPSPHSLFNLNVLLCILSSPHRDGPRTPVTLMPVNRRERGAGRRKNSEIQHTYQQPTTMKQNDCVSACGHAATVRNWRRSSVTKSRHLHVRVCTPLSRRWCACASRSSCRCVCMAA